MKSFTLIEILIVVGIMTILAAIGSVSFFSFRAQNNLNLTTKEILSLLRNAQNRSITQENGVNWGVRLGNPSNQDGFYALFQGAAYSSANTVLRANLPPAVQFNDPLSGANKDIVFNSISGLPADSATVIISLKNNPSDTRTIIINANGQIQY
ncbi:prepilin-type N-terminal cleavage/methylation domain-containing protein [Candidatus Wolfebacteria bacterium]|nr:prepilin-type N-terminal cleavage/methylation domain-containing protein [Candidatus Wolfebacteria bacterium]